MRCTGSAITVSVAIDVSRLVHCLRDSFVAEYAYYYRDAANSTAYSALQYGAWILELQAHIKTRLAGGSPVKYFHNVGHDGGVAPLLGFLQIDGMVWPGMGSE